MHAADSSRAALAASLVRALILCSSSLSLCVFVLTHSSCAMSDLKVTHKPVGREVTTPPPQWMVVERAEAKCNGEDEPTDDELKYKWEHVLISYQRARIRKRLKKAGYDVKDTVADAEPWWIKKQQDPAGPDDGAAAAHLEARDEH